MVKIVHAQTVITIEDLLALKEKTGESSTKDAIAKAIEHYLKCPYTADEELWRAKLEKMVERKGEVKKNARNVDKRRKEPQNS
ncbi:hypothetical protein DRN72_02960 [Methanosarcinales archaeon]|nr:MAG: hypothetical protein DRN72_02960 [Methanosarcinales archaeon]